MNNTPRNLSKAGVALLTGLAFSISAYAAGAPDDFAKGCAAGKGNDCFKLGEAYLRGSGAPRDFAKARSAFEKGCSLNDGAGCNGMGIVSENGLGGAKNMSQ
ncbi:MAG: hypothetical protein VZR11_13130, partial [Succinimonas sp.]|nr:hypothetical protein [Succinimonas sp.]